jgi:hypothetical protein
MSDGGGPTVYGTITVEFIRNLCSAMPMLPVALVLDTQMV